MNEAVQTHPPIRHHIVAQVVTRTLWGSHQNFLFERSPGIGRRALVSESAVASYDLSDILRTPCGYRFGHQEVGEICCAASCCRLSDQKWTPPSAVTEQAPIRNAGTPQDSDRSASQPPTSDSTFDAKFKVPLTTTAVFKRSYSSQLPPHTAAILANILPMKVVFFLAERRYSLDSAYAPMVPTAFIDQLAGHDGKPRGGGGIQLN
ncbi:hypothetical protein BKA93DRAFT_358053 [Sparassis latifolia]